MPKQRENTCSATNIERATNFLYIYKQFQHTCNKYKKNFSMHSHIQNAFMILKIVKNYSFRFGSQINTVYVLGYLE